MTEEEKMGTPKKPIEVNSKNILEIIKNCRSVLDDPNVPTEGRKLAIMIEEEAGPYTSYKMGAGYFVTNPDGKALWVRDKLFKEVFQKVVNSKMLMREAFSVWEKERKRCV